VAIFTGLIAAIYFLAVTKADNGETFQQDITVLPASVLMIRLFLRRKILSLKVTVFWDVAPFVWQKFFRRFTLMMMEAASTSEIRFTSTRLHGTKSQKTVIFILATVRTLNLIQTFSSPKTPLVYVVIYLKYFKLS
jgi:hypothetical protein